MVESRIKQTTESFNPGEDLEPLPCPSPSPQIMDGTTHRYSRLLITRIFKGNRKKSLSCREVEEHSREKAKKQFLITHLNREVEERLCDYWNIRKDTLDYKSERNVTKHCLNRAYDLLFWEVKLFHVRFVTNNISPRGGGGTWVFFGWVCAAWDSKLAPRSKKNFP